jgi:hypothetical protein
MSSFRRSSRRVIAGLGEQGSGTQSARAVNRALILIYWDIRKINGFRGPSIEPAAESEIDRLWIEEAQRRHDELLAGAQAIPADEVFAKARALLR